MNRIVIAPSQRSSERRGAILVLTAVLMVVLLGFVVMRVDIGFIELTRTQLQSAAAAKTDKIKILTISLGAGADTSLMQQVADITGGEHFNVPGGASISDMQAQLEVTFRRIANSRTLRLISDQ